MSMRELLWLSFLLFLASTASAEVTDDSVRTEPNKAVDIPVLTNDGLGTSASIEGVVREPLNGTVVISSDKKVLTYTPNENFTGSDRLVYSASVDGKTSGEGEAIIQVQGGLGEVLTSDQMLALSKVLLTFLVMSLLLEFALSRIFEFRWFIRWMEGRGLKLPVAVVFALLLIMPLGLDLVTEVARILNPEKPHDPWWLTYFLSALILSGGSATIFQLYRALGLRAPLQDESDPEKRKDFGRVTFLVKRAQKDGVQDSSPLEVYIDDDYLGVIEGSAKQYPGTTSPSLPVETGVRTLAVARSPRLDGDEYWVRHIGIRKFHKAVVPFDLSTPPNAEYRYVPKESLD
jgi:hypothetical protein